MERVSEDAAARIVRTVMERWASEEAGDYQLHVQGDDWRRFCADLEDEIRRCCAGRPA